MLPPIPREIQAQILKTVDGFFGSAWFDCKHYHEGSCEAYGLLKFSQLLRAAVGVYLPVHLIPLLLFKRKQIKQQPVQSFYLASYNLSKSICFISFMVTTIIYMLCKSKNLRQLTTSLNPITAGMLGSIGLLLESNIRRQEICLFVIPRALSTIVGMLQRRHLLFKANHTDIVVFALVIAIIGYYYEKNPNALKPSVKKFIQMFWGLN